MNCKEVENNLMFYIEGDLDKSITEKITEHLQTCTSCKMLYEKMKSDLVFLSNDKIIETNPFFYNRLEESINSDKNKSSRIIKQVYLQVLAYAAAVIIAIFIGIALGKSYQPINNYTADENTELSEFQLFAESYGYSTPMEDDYELILTDNE